MTNVEKLEKIANDYYNGRETGITDKEYDELEAEVQKEFPGYNVKEHIVYDSNVVKCKHLYPFIGIKKDKYDKGSNLTKFVESPDATLVPKYDGSSIRAYYQNGKLTNILSRADEVTGVNQTEKLRKKVIEEVPEWVKYVDYELLVPYDDFGENSRQHANGIVNSKYLDDKVEKFAFAAPFYCNEYNGMSYKERMLAVCGERFGGKLPYEFDRSVLENFVIDRVQINGLTYPIDGIVCYNDVASPLKNKIFKFYYIETAETTVESIQWNRSPFGYYIPKVILKPVELSGKWIKQTAAGSVDTIFANKICKGAKVEIILAGLTIPQIHRVLEVPEVQDYTIDDCWDCKSKLSYTSTGYVCTNPNCKFYQSVVVSNFIRELYPVQFRVVVNQGGSDSIEALIDKIGSSDTILNETKTRVLDWARKPGGLADMVIAFLGISRLSPKSRKLIAGDMSPTLDGIKNALLWNLSARAQDEIKYKLPVLIELLSRLDSLFKLKFGEEFINKE